jgi:hypothetical protein
VVEVLSAWFYPRSLAQLDSAFCSLKDRRIIIFDTFQSPHFTVEGNMIWFTNQMYVGWLIKRRIKMSSFIVKAQTIESIAILAKLIKLDTTRVRAIFVGAVGCCRNGSFVFQQDLTELINSCPMLCNLRVSGIEMDLSTPVQEKKTTFLQQINTLILNQLTSLTILNCHFDQLDDFRQLVAMCPNLICLDIEFYHVLIAGANIKRQDIVLCLESLIHLNRLNVHVHPYK